VVALDSTTLATGTHSLVAKAFYAANNSAASAPVGFSVNYVVATSQELIVNGGFESGTAGWTVTTCKIDAFVFIINRHAASESYASSFRIDDEAGLRFLTSSSHTVASILPLAFALEKKPVNGRLATQKLGRLPEIVNAERR